jgi:putative phosphotransacetylase
MQNYRASTPVLVNVSARHIHLSKDILEILFGKNYNLTKTKDLLQPGEYACVETLTVVGPRNSIEKVRILGPLRNHTQVEVSITDTIKLGIVPCVRLSGDLANTQPIKLVGTQGSIDLKEGCIVAKRHIHFTTQEALNYRIKDKESLSIKFIGERGLIFDNVIARVSNNMISECHLDADEANAAGVKSGAMAIIV